MAEITENDEVLFPELFKTDGSGEVRLDAGYSKESDNWTFTVVRRSLPEFPVPYALALVDFPEGVRVMAQVETDNPEGLKIGQKMGVTVGVVKKAQDGKNVKSYKFYPVNK